MKTDIRALTGWAVTVVLIGIVAVGLFMGDTRPQDRAASLGSAIKCPVCQGEAIIDSPSPTAQAMMDIVREKVAAGETDQQIFSYFQARFGEGILLDPPLAGTTLLVWILPFLVAAGGVRLILSRRRPAEPAHGEPS